MLWLLQNLELSCCCAVALFADVPGSAASCTGHNNVKLLRVLLLLLLTTAVSPCWISFPLPSSVS
jgi:hypothetical protein